MEIRLASWIVLVGSALVSAGCSGGVYSTVPAGDGSVFVVNRFTGAIQRVHGDEITEPGKQQRRASLPVSANPPDHRMALREGTVMNQPIKVTGAAKYRDGKMLVRISVMQTAEPMSDAQLSQWRSHVLELRSTASLQLHFMDADGFEIMADTVALSSMTQNVDLDGKLYELEEQVALPMSAQDFEAISGWNIGWSGFWPAYTAEPVPSTQKHKS